MHLYIRIRIRIRILYFHAIVKNGSKPMGEILDIKGKFQTFPLACRTARVFVARFMLWTLLWYTAATGEVWKQYVSCEGAPECKARYIRRWFDGCVITVVRQFSLPPPPVCLCVCVQCFW